MSVLRCCVAAWIALAAAVAFAQTPEKTVEQAVDEAIGQRLRAAGVSPSALADDATLVRRLTLDLAGRIPTPAEAKEYVQSTAPDKRKQLVERLLASPEFPRHQRNQFDMLLLPSREDDGWRRYLLQAFENNLPWDKLFVELMLASDENPSHRSALQFLKTRARDLDEMTRDTARLFFGVDISCAKCHDHPHVDDWKQDHYFGMASFFNRTYEEREFLGERGYGSVKFKTKEGQEKQAKLSFLGGSEIAEPVVAEPTDEERRAEDMARQQREKDRAMPLEPLHSRRRLLVDVALQPENQSFLARSIVNRLWARFFGRGLVMPLDQMHSANPASHPELLDWLARDLMAQRYDLRRLIRGLVLSDAYARASRWESASEPPAENLFALARVRALTPRQYGLSLAVATASPEWLAEQARGAQWPDRLNELEGRTRGVARQIEIPDENFQVSVTEALLLSNSPEVERDLLRDSNDRLVGRLKALPVRPEAIETAFWSVLSRAPQPEETQAIDQYLAARADRPAQAMSQIVWALATSAEFRFNH